MRKSKFTESQIAAALEQADATSSPPLGQPLQGWPCCGPCRRGDPADRRTRTERPCRHRDAGNASTGLRYGRLHDRRTPAALLDHGALRRAVLAARLASRDPLRLSRRQRAADQGLAHAPSRRGAMDPVRHPWRGTRGAQCHCGQHRHHRRAGGLRRADGGDPARQSAGVPAQLALPEHAPNATGRRAATASATPSTCCRISNRAAGHAPPPRRVRRPPR